MLVGVGLDKDQQPLGAQKEIANEMARCLGGIAEIRCRASFAKVFNYFAPRLRSYALRQMGNEAQAMELVQDTMSNVWQKAHLFNSEKGSASTWIFTIARNIRFDMLRRQQHRKEDLYAEDLWPVLYEQAAEIDEDQLDQDITLQQVGEFFEQLPDKQSTVIKAIYIEGKSQQEVAEMLEIPLGTVKSRTRLALQRLRELMQEHD